MTPTRLLLEAFCAAIAEPDGPPGPGPVDHFLLDPEPVNDTWPNAAALTVTAVDIDGNTVDTYVGPPDAIIPSGVCDPPTDFGWSGGVGSYLCTSSGPGDGTILFADTVLGVGGTSNQHWS